MYPVWLWSLPQVALSQPSILARSWWEAAPSEDGLAQTETVSSPCQSAGMACQTSTQRCKSTTNTKRCFPFNFPHGVILLLHVSFVFHFGLIIKQSGGDVGQECGQASRHGGRVPVSLRDDMSTSPRLWCFLAGFRRRLTILWSGCTGLLKSPAHHAPSRLALQWQTL